MRVNLKFWHVQSNQHKGYYNIMSKPIKSVNQTIILLMFNVISLVFLVGCSTTANVVESTTNKVKSTASEVKSTGTEIINISDIKDTSNTGKSLAVKPAPDTSFIKHSERQTKRADLPFQKVWIKPGFEKNNYKELMVAPVNT